MPPMWDCAERAVFVVDPMLATGGSASAAITMLKQKGVKNIRFMCSATERCTPTEKAVASGVP